MSVSSGRGYVTYRMRKPQNQFNMLSWSCSSNPWSKWLLSGCVRAIPAAWRQTGFPRLSRERASCWRGQGSARLLLRSLTQWLGRGSEGASVGLIVRGQDGGSVMRCLCFVFSLPSSPRLYSALGECRRGCWRPHRSHGQIFLNDQTNWHQLLALLNLLHLFCWNISCQISQGNNVNISTELFVFGVKQAGDTPCVTSTTLIHQTCSNF